MKGAETSVRDLKTELSAVVRRAQEQTVRADAAEREVRQQALENARLRRRVAELETTIRCGLDLIEHARGAALEGV